MNLQVEANDMLSETYGKYLTFYCYNQLFAVSIRNVVEIVSMQVITPIPESPNYAKGIINLRGSIIPVIDTRTRLGKYEKEYDERTCIIICTIGNMDRGFIVDSVDEVVKIDDDAISSIDNTGTEVANDYISGIANVQNKIILVLDIEKLIKHP